VREERPTFEERKRAFWKWHSANPEVWEYFERFALEAVSRRHRRISHWLIVNRIRWETSVITTGKDYKISNDLIAFYARLWNAKHPEHAELFQLKRMIGEDLDN